MAKKLATTTEPKKPHDKYVVKVLKDNEVVGHIPRDLSKHCTSVLLGGGTMECVFIEQRENKRREGLKVPCKYIAKGPKYMLTNTECMIKFLEHILYFKEFFVMS